MLRLSAVFCVLLLSYFLFTCRRTDIDAVKEPDLLLDGKPRLTFVSFSGIPQENISIDQKNRRINIRILPILPDIINISAEVTENAEWIYKQTAVSGGTLFGCDSCFHILLKDKAINVANAEIMGYTVKTIGSAPMRPDLTTLSFTYIINDNSNFRGSLDIPMLNLYGNKLPKEAHLIHNSTGEKLIIKRSINSFISGLHYSLSSNKLGINLHGQNVLPGDYSIEFLLDDDSVLKLPQPVTVIPGIAYLNYEEQIYYGYRVVVGENLTIDGYNLFEKTIALELVDKNDKVYPLPISSFSRYGKAIQIPFPTHLVPGQYVLRVFQKEVKLPYCVRVNILKDSQERPVIGTIGSERFPCSLRDPVLLPSGGIVTFTSNQVKQGLDERSQTVTLKLIPATGTTALYGIVTPYDYRRTAYPGSLQIPSSVPAGIYTAILQVLDAQNGVVSESDPYGRLLEVR
jgi:hypothetical protein